MKKVKKPMTVGQLIDSLNKQDKNAIVKIGVSFWFNKIPSEAEGYVGCSVMELSTPDGEILLEGEDELNKGE